MCDQIQISCSIHCTDAADGLVLLEKSTTWETLQKAAEIRGHTLPINENDGLPNIYYHRKCYQYFTMKSKLGRLLKDKQQENSVLESVKEKNTSPTDHEKKINRSKKSTNILPKILISCRKKKYKFKILEPLIHYCDFRAMHSLKIIATQKNDFNILSILTQDLIAIEGHYHKSCYCKYTLSNKNIDRDHQDEYAYKTREQEAFKKIIDYLHELAQSSNLVPFTNISSMMEDTMMDLGVEITSSTKRHLKRNIEEKISNVKFINVDDNLYVYPTSLTIQSVITDFVKTQNKLKKVMELDEEKISEMEKNILLSAANIRKDIIDMTDTIH